MSVDKNNWLEFVSGVIDWVYHMKLDDPKKSIAWNQGAWFAFNKERMEKIEGKEYNKENNKRK